MSATLAGPACRPGINAPYPSSALDFADTGYKRGAIAAAGAPVTRLEGCGRTRKIAHRGDSFEGGR